MLNITCIRVGWVRFRHNLYGAYDDECLIFIRIIREIILPVFNNFFLGKVWKNNF